MRRLIATAVFIQTMVFNVHAQQPHLDYGSKWKLIDSLMGKRGLVSSALREVTLVYEAARKQENETQMIKAILFRRKIMRIKDPQDAEKNFIRDLRTAAQTSHEPAKSIIESLLADGLWNYYLIERAKVPARTKSDNFRKDDLETWSAEDFHREINGAFMSSVKNEAILQKTSLDHFDPIIKKGNLRRLRPTLFDLLVNSAIDFLVIDPIDYGKSANSFEIDVPASFAEASVFAQYPFRSSDTLSDHLLAVHLFQRLLVFRLADANKDALIDADIKRLNFVYDYAIMVDKDKLYVQGLKTITDRFGQLPGATQAWYLQANHFAFAAESYDPIDDTSNRYGLVQAHEICEKVVSERDSSEGKSNCQDLLTTIERKSLVLKTEQVNVPGVPFRALLTSRNISTLYFRIVQVSHQQRENLSIYRGTKDIWKKLIELPYIRRFSQRLPATGDFQLHRTELKIDSLPVGEFYLVASTDSAFSIDRNLLAYEAFHVSGIAYIKNGLDYFVVNRVTGLPIQRADIQLWYRRYDKLQQREIASKGENIITDKNGFFRLSPPRTQDYRNFNIEFTTPDDHLFLGEEEEFESYTFGNDTNFTNRQAYENDNLNTYFFTDRAIYRPGQEIFFKGLMVSRDFGSGQPKIMTQLKSMVFLYDVNEQAIDSQIIVTNEFGSYQGHFNLPANRLNGRFSIVDKLSKSRTELSVEEYKRPTFKISYDLPTGNSRLNDTVTITGTVVGYAGISSSGSSIKYRVTRQSHVPFDRLKYGRLIPLQRTSAEIANGLIIADTKGKFEIHFLAVPDRSITKKSNQSFTYVVSVDATDIAGETATAQTSIEVGYSALSIAIGLSDRTIIRTDSLRDISISTFNTAGQFLATEVTVRVFRLRSPYRLIRSRYWERPDQFVMSKEEFLKTFPNDEYNNEGDPKTWEKIEKVFDRRDSVKEGVPFSFGTSRFAPGWYVIEASANDKYGTKVSDSQFIRIVDPITDSPPSPEFNWFPDLTVVSEPGNHVTAEIGSSANNVFVISQLQRKSYGESNAAATQDTSFNYGFFPLSNEQRKLKIELRESDRGGIRLQYAFVKDNRFYFGVTNVNVPWTNKELSITFQTFRDNTEPGSLETWKLKVEGFNKDKVAAELLTGMYDASLDQFVENQWNIPELYRANYFETNLAGKGFKANESIAIPLENPYTVFDFIYDNLLDAMSEKAVRLSYLGSGPEGFRTLARENMINGGLIRSVSKNMLPKIAFNDEDLTVPKAAPVESPVEIRGAQAPQIEIRKNLQETAFFFPDLKTDSSGRIEFSFKMPEALTQWKWMNIAHTKNLAFGRAEKYIHSQKRLMVQPNLPRFLREGDKIMLSARIINATDSELTGQTELQLFDPTTSQAVDGFFTNREANQYFTVEAGQNVEAGFPIEVPFQYNRPLSVRIIVRAKDFSDGEEDIIPVMSNRMLVTETLPLSLHDSETKDLKFEKLLRSGESETLSQHALTIEYSGNPIWYAVQALPYMMEYPYECIEQVFERLYANAVASDIVSHTPNIRETLEEWGASDSSAFLSNLEKNQDLKSVLLQETPWVVQSKNEMQQKKELALLLDKTRMDGEIRTAIDKMQAVQNQDGGFPWFAGGTSDLYITQYILSGIGHLKKMAAFPDDPSQEMRGLIESAISFLDSRIMQDYDHLIKSKSNTAKDRLGPLEVQYLYMRSFYPEEAIPGSAFQAVNYFRKQAQLFWVDQGRQTQAMIALALFRTGDIKTARDILASLKETATTDNDMGMYWQEIPAAFHWYQSPVEAASLILEAFQEISQDSKAVENIRIWLLRQKQTNSWKTTIATADACYGLLIGNRRLTSPYPQVRITLGDSIVSEESRDAASGVSYFRKTIDGNFVKPEMGNIHISQAYSKVDTKPNNAFSWGAVYWQYFEELDKISRAVSPLHVIRKLFVEKNTERGPILEAVEDNSVIKIGSRVKIRIELNVDRNLEYVHLKDMRASCMEPVDVISGIKWDHDLEFYQSTKDASTNFFIASLPKGTHVFEYTVFISAAGNFSSGISSAECMYAPEFNSHTEGLRINSE